MQSSAVRNARNSERGMTLAETLVAVAIFAIVFIAALTLYTAANRAYLATDSATIQQQNTRFAMDRMMETLRDAGANYNTLGSASLPDEQVEGAWQSAIFVRGDYDNHRERTAEGAPTTLEASDNVHDIVTTGNDEIVGYVLRKPVGATDPNTITLTIKADFSAPRDATLSGTTIANEESKTVKVAATDLPGQTSPPYQLVRVTFDASGTAQYDVIAENVFRLSFTYYNSSNATITTPPGSDDGTSNADRTTRGTIRKFDVNLIGMSDRPDSQYTDTTVYSPAEGTATKHYRKFSLSEHILAPNLGVKGKKHQFAPSTSITAPASLTVCTGHCYYFHLSWPASSTSNVTTYKIHVTAAAGSTAAAVDQYITVDDLEYNYKQPDTELRAFNFQVAGTGVGGDGAYTSTATATSSNAAQSIPSAPANVNAEQEVHIDALALEVTWEPVTTNTQALNTALCTTVGSGAGSTVPTATWNTDAPDIDHYEVYRVRSTGTNSGADATTTRIDNVTIGELTNTTPAGTAFIDYLAAPCSSYFYRVKACDHCSVTGDFSAAMSTPATVALADGISPSAPSAPTTTSFSYDGSDYTLQLQWLPVTRTNFDQKAAVTHYILKRYRKLASQDDSQYALEWTSETASPIYSESSTVLGPSMTIPATNGANGSGQDYSYKFTVTAQYDCASPRQSAESPAYVLSRCTPTSPNIMSISSPTNGGVYSRPYEVAVPIKLSAGGSGWTQALVSITDANGNTVYEQSMTTPTGGFYTFPNWDVSDINALPNGQYTLTAVGLVGTCRTDPMTATIRLDNGSCGLSLASFTALPSTGTSFTFKVQNTCDDTSIRIDSLAFTWTGGNALGRITKLQYNGVNITATSLYGSGTPIPLTTTQTIQPSTTTAASFTVTYSVSMKTTPAMVISSIAATSAPGTSTTTTTDELLSGSIQP